MVGKHSRGLVQMDGAMHAVAARFKENSDWCDLYVLLGQKISGNDEHDYLPCF